MFKPINNRVLIKPDEVENVTQSGILLVKAGEEKPVTGTVVVGGVFEGRAINAGDRVLFSKFGYDEVVIDKQPHYVVSFQTILGIF